MKYNFFSIVFVLLITCSLSGQQIELNHVDKYKGMSFFESFKGQGSALIYFNLESKSNQLHFFDTLLQPMYTLDLGGTEKSMFYLAAKNKTHLLIIEDQSRENKRLITVNNEGKTEGDQVVIREENVDGNIDIIPASDASGFIFVMGYNHEFKKSTKIWKVDNMLNLKWEKLLFDPLKYIDQSNVFDFENQITFVKRTNNIRGKDKNHLHYMFMDYNGTFTDSVDLDFDDYFLLPSGVLRNPNDNSVRIFGHFFEGNTFISSLSRGLFCATIERSKVVNLKKYTWNEIEKQFDAFDRIASNEKVLFKDAVFDDNGNLLVAAESVMQNIKVSYSNLQGGANISGIWAYGQNPYLFRSKKLFVLKFNISNDLQHTVHIEKPDAHIHVSSQYLYPYRVSMLNTDPSPFCYLRKNGTFGFAKIPLSGDTEARNPAFISIDFANDLNPSSRNEVPFADMKGPNYKKDYNDLLGSFYTGTNKYGLFYYSHKEKSIVAKLFNIP